MEHKLNTEVKELPIYVVPEVTTYTEAELLEELGPAQANVGSQTVDAD